MIRKAGRRAFTALSGLLDLPGTENLNAIDISVAQPTVDLISMVRRAGVTPWVFIGALDATLAGINSYFANADVRVGSQWEKIVRDLEEVSYGVPSREDFLCTRVGVYSSNDANFLDFAFYASIDGTVNTDPTLRRIMWYGDSSVGRHVIQANARADIVPLPWLFRAENQEPWGWGARLGAGDPMQVNLMLEGWSGPVGAFDAL